MALKFVKESPNKGYGYFECDCGHIKEIRHDHVKYGKIKSCGCLRNRLTSERCKILHDATRTHGLSRTSTYSTWCGMKSRCNNPKNKFFHHYGGRGISVCERWMKFDNFLADMGKKPNESLSLERIDNNGPYSPENCRWATKSEQMENRRTNKRIFHNGENLTLSQWAKKTGINPQTISARLALGWSADKILLPEKQVNLVGLSLGREASALKRKAKTHCKYGHEFTPENTGKNGKNGRSCRKCKCIKQKAYILKKQQLQPPSSG